MTLLERDPTAAADDGEARDDVVDEAAAPGDDAAAAAASDTGGGPSPAPPPVSARTVGVALLSCAGAAMTVGGVFGSWAARGFGVAAVAVGVAWAVVCVRRVRGRIVSQLLVLPLTAVLAAASVAVGAGGADPRSLVADAVASGRELSIPVPFDPGWRPVLVGLFVMLGFATGWVSMRLARPQTALLLPLPLLGLAMISQPPDDEVLAGFLGFVPLVAAATLLFGNQGDGSNLGREFELKRLLRSAGLAVPLLVVVFLLAQTSFLFPPPVYDPDNQPQKPKSIPLSAARDRVLFEVDGPISGPWRIGALDVYDGVDWRLGPFDAERLRPLAGDGVIDEARAADVTVRFTARDLGNSSTFPTPSTPARASFGGDVDVLVDPRTETLRLKSGRIADGTTYEVSLPTYPTPAALQAASPDVPPDIQPFLEIPDPPEAVRDLLAAAPGTSWERLALLRTKLNEVVIATGAGTPVSVRPSVVQRLLAGNHEGTPFEIVAAEAMLARWAGVPSRIGFGFDGGQKETVGGREAVTIRPKNASQFLEVWFAGYGWVPLVSSPPRAKATLESDPNQVFDPTVLPSEDVAVQVVIPFEPESLTFVYEQVRRALAIAVPIVLLLIAIYVALPALQKWRRTNLRRRWAAARGPRHQVAVAYAELRDRATDLSVGDPIDSPLDYRARVVPDPEHDELAWLVSRVLYGDLGPVVGPDDAVAAWEMSTSLQRRMTRAQPRQTQVLALLSRASLLEPYTDEVPNVSPLVLRLRRRRRPASSTSGRRRSRRPLRRRLRAATSVPYLGKTHAAAAAISSKERR